MKIIEFTEDNEENELCQDLFMKLYSDIDNLINRHCDLFPSNISEEKILGTIMSAFTSILWRIENQTKLYGITDMYIKMQKKKYPRT